MPVENPPSSPILDQRPSTSRRSFLRTGVAAGFGLAALPAFLAACSGDPATPATSVGDGAGGGPAATPAPATTGVNYPTGYKGPRATQKKPFGDGTKTFKVVVPEDTVTVNDWNKNQFSAWFEQRTGVKVEYQTVPTTNNDMTKINAMIGAGDLPDAFLNIPFTRDQISLFGSQGVFVPLDDHIDKYAVELKQAMVDAPDLKALAKSGDGKTYVFPAVNDCRQCKVSPGRSWVNKKFIDRVGTKVPETTDEFRAMLLAFKTDDASGHGDTVPFAAGLNSAIDRWVMNAFLYNPGEPWLRLDDGKVDFVANKPEWRQGLQFLRTLYDDGTLTADAFTMSDQSLQKLGNTPGHARIGVARTYYWGIFMDIITEPDARWHDYVPIPPLKGPGGVRNAAWDYYQPYLLNSFVITSNCSDPASLVQWADYQMELEATMRSAWGVKDKDWQWTPKGVKSIEGEQAIWRQMVGGSEASVPAGHGWNQHAVMYRSNNFRLGEEANFKNPSFATILDQDTVEPYYEPYQQPKEWQLPPLVFDEDAAATNADVALELSNHVKQSMAQFSIAKLDINDDAVWKSYTDKIDKIGLSRYVESYQKAYDNRPTA